MLSKFKNIISKTDHFLYKKFGSDKGTKFLENIKEAQKIFSYLNTSNEANEVRFVGGCVRKAICGENIDDIDLATSIKPEDVKKALLSEKIKIIETGISHGTITAFLNEKKFEITTLRKDVETDGRHANVEFSNNWELDASRRDFTINAIYSDIQGRIFDPQNGIADLKNGKIRFIGLPEERIQEDYLRILRYFRFFTQYSKNEHDKDVIKSIKQNINGLNKVSNERIFDELQKILLIKNLNALFAQSDSNEIILHIFSQFKYTNRLKKINEMENKLKIKFDSFLILALLIVDQSHDYEYFCHKYNVSNKIKKRFKNISENFENLNNKKFYSEDNIKKSVYFLGKNYVKDLLLFSFCENSKIKNIDFEKVITFVENYKIPKFPLSGDDLKKYGYETGRELGKKLKLLEEQWIENNFFLDNKTIEKFLSKN